METFVNHSITIAPDASHPKFVKLDCASASDDAGLKMALLQLQSLHNGLATTPFPAEVPGPPPQSINPGRTPHVEQLKKKGNEHFGKKEHQQALQLYTQALDVAISRPPWEPCQMASEEIATLLSNRSAAFLQAGAAPEAYADAHFCIVTRPNWSKGYFRCAKAQIQLDKLKAALQTLERGLAYEPTNSDLLALKAEVEDALLDSNLSRWL
ncbi:hypothetical protein PYCC9005_000016 [Savitreella phatthalungensis]